MVIEESKTQQVSFLVGYYGTSVREAIIKCGITCPKGL